MKRLVTGITIGQIAKVAHQANKAFCETIGDKSQKDWEEAENWQRMSAINGVTFHLQNPDASASASHDSWMKEKIETGWVFGEEKDELKKTHPCIVPFKDLPLDQQRKDHLFKSIAKTFMR